MLMIRNVHISLLAIPAGREIPGASLMLNYLWSFMILTGIVYAAFTGRMPDITNAALDSSKEAISLCITMIGVMSFCKVLPEIAPISVIY